MRLCGGTEEDGKEVQEEVASKYRMFEEVARRYMRRWQGGKG